MLASARQLYIAPAPLKLWAQAGGCSRSDAAKRQLREEPRARLAVSARAQFCPCASKSKQTHSRPRRQSWRRRRRSKLLRRGPRSRKSSPAKSLGRLHPSWRSWVASRMPSFQSTCFNSGNTCRRARSGPELQECVKLGVFRGSSSGRCCSHARLGVRATHRFISVVAGTAHRFMKRHRPWGDWCLSGDKPRGVVLFEKKMFRAVAVNYDVPPSGCRVTVSSLLGFPPGLPSGLPFWACLLGFPSGLP